MIIVRKAVPSDADAVSEMAKMFDRSFRFQESTFRATFAEIIVRNDMFLAVAEDGRDVAGYLLGSICPAFHAKVARIEEVGAEPFACWGDDPIAPLISAFEDWATENNCRVAKISSSFPPNKFYESLGFEMKGFYYRKRI